MTETPAAANEFGDEVRRAAAAYMKDWRRRTLGVAAFDWPVELRPDLADVPTLGVALAQAWRSS